MAGACRCGDASFAARQFVSNAAVLVCPVAAALLVCGSLSSLSSERWPPKLPLSHCLRRRRCPTAGLPAACGPLLLQCGDCGKYLKATADYTLSAGDQARARGQQAGACCCRAPEQPSTCSILTGPSSARVLACPQGRRHPDNDPSITRCSRCGCPPEAHEVAEHEQVGGWVLGSSCTRPRGLCVGLVVVQCRLSCAAVGMLAHCQLTALHHRCLIRVRCSSCMSATAHPPFPPHPLPLLSCPGARARQ